MLTHALYFSGAEEVIVKASQLERKFQSDLVREIHDMIDGCIVMKNDSAQIQGIPDLIVIYRDRWAMLEVKPFERAIHQPNQDYYVEKFNDWSFAAFIYPENKEEILDGLQQALRPRRKTRIPQRQ